MTKARLIIVFLGILLVQPVYSEVSDLALMKLVESLEGLRADIRNCLCSSPSIDPSTASTSPTVRSTPASTDSTTKWPQPSTASSSSSSLSSSSSSASVSQASTSPGKTISGGTLTTSAIPFVTYNDCESVPSGYPQYVLLTDLENREYLCDRATDGGHWTVIQRRFDGSVDFQQSWEAYEKGFGDPRGEYWLGLSQVYHLTHNSAYELRVDITLADGGTTHASYKTVTIGHPSDHYRLGIDDYSGSAADYLGFGSGNLDLNGMTFSTYDSDNDKDTADSCSLNHGRGGWWFNHCAFSNLNGVWGQPAPEGVHWGTSSLIKHVEMKIRPVVSLK